MSQNKLELVEFHGKKIDSRLNDLKDALFKQVPSLVFNYITKGYGAGDAYDIDGNKYYRRLEVFDSTNLKTAIGIIGIDDNNYFVVSPNIKDGRHYWSGSFQGQRKQSKHMKNMVKVGVNNLKTLTFDQAMSECEITFHRNIQSKMWDYNSRIGQATGGVLNLDFKEDMLALFKQGYEPKSPNFKNIMTYIANNLDYLEKYKDYNPKSVGIWVCSDRVEYKVRNEDEIKIVPTKQDLPQDILGKICLMDISEPRQFDESLGYKHSDAEYWVICED
jgi:hypothetical protein